MKLATMTMTDSVGQVVFSWEGYRHV